MAVVAMAQQERLLERKRGADDPAGAIVVGQAVGPCIGLTPPASGSVARVPQIYVHSNYTISGFMRSVLFYASRALCPVWF